VFFLRGVRNGAFEWKTTDFQTPAEALAYYEERMAALIAEVGTLPIEKLAKAITFANWTESAVAFLNIG
jgi:hypothetical protein